MPVPGRAPKPDGQKRNRVKPVHEWVEVADVPFAGKPPVSAERDWPPATKRWWRVVTHMPHCILWNATDWQFAYDTAMMVAKFHEGDWRTAPEIRQRERMMGTTFDSRREIRVRYITAADNNNDEDGTVTTIADYQASIGA